MNDVLPTDNVVVPDPVSSDDSQNDVNTISISPEAPPVPMPEAAPVADSVETLTPEVGNEQMASPEVVAPVAPVLSDPSSEQQVAPVQQIAPVSPPEHVVDKREHHSGDHKLQTTDKLTAEADEEEADFIDHVEEVHSIK